MSHAAPLDRPVVDRVDEGWVELEAVARDEASGVAPYERILSDARHMSDQNAAFVRESVAAWMTLTERERDLPRSL